MAASSSPAFKVLIEKGGAYRVGFGDLLGDGLDASIPLPSDALGVTSGGAPVPVWVVDGGDGSFGPGDWLELVAEPLRGEVSYYSEHSRYNVYRLSFDHPNPARMSPAPALPLASSLPEHGYRAVRHYEEDLQLLRLAPRDGNRQESWYWAKLVHGDRRPFVFPLDLRNLDPQAAAPVEIRIQLKGWSEPRNKAAETIADHRVEIALDGQHLATREWNGSEPQWVEVVLPARSLRRGQLPLALSVPKRFGALGGEVLIDVVMLNWIEVAYPRDDWIDPQAAFELAEPGAAARLRLVTPAAEQLVLYGRRGSRMSPPGIAKDGRRVTSVAVPAGERGFVASLASGLLRPAAVVRDRPSRLLERDQQADYLIVTHRRLRPASETLAALHRTRGLTVRVVDIEDVFDEFHHGIEHPDALRAFVAHAYHRWRRPAPRFLLLVGDASWDRKNPLADDARYADWTYRPGETRHFGKNRSTPYGERAERRGLVPTWSYGTHQGHAASDNHYAAVAGDDRLPDLAVGRLPVTEPWEVESIAEKVRRYLRRGKRGAWRQRALFISNEMPAFRRRSDQLADWLVSRGFSAQKVYPSPADTMNARHTRRILEGFDNGQLLVHFLGHGGRYIWRTGPPDLKKNHDLFTLEHLEQLRPTDRLPLVLSWTCYSAPFDHPTADSIGEKLLRLEDRGALAVFAASWRNRPRAGWSRALLEELTRPDATIGEAVLRAKRRQPDPLFVETYNLLGDPAVPLALAHRVPGRGGRS